MITISEAIRDYLNTIKLARSENTLLAYHTALDNLAITLKDNNIDVEIDPVDKINEEIISWFAQDLKSYAATTEQLYITAAKGFLEFLVAEELSVVNLSKAKLLIGKERENREKGYRNSLPKVSARSWKKRKMT